MNDKPKTDWDAALAMFVRGETYAAIAGKIGVTPDAARMHGSRHNWGRLRTQTAVSALQSAGEPLTAAEESLVQKSRRVREAIAADVIESAKLLPKLRQTTNARGFRERQSAVAELAGVAAKTFAWGADDQRPSIRISVLNLATIRSADTPAEPAAIDVESSPTTPTDPAA